MVVWIVLTLSWSNMTQCPLGCMKMPFPLETTELAHLVTDHQADVIPLAQPFHADAIIDAMFPCSLHHCACDGITLDIGQSVQHVGWQALQQKLKLRR